VRGCVPIPPDRIGIQHQYELALVLIALLKPGQAADLAHAKEIANTFDDALTHDTHGEPATYGQWRDRVA